MGSWERKGYLPNTNVNDTESHFQNRHLRVETLLNLKELCWNDTLEKELVTYFRCDIENNS